MSYPAKRHHWWHGLHEEYDSANRLVGLYCFRCARWLRYDDDLRRWV